MTPDEDLELDVSIDAVYEARDRIAARALQTPLLRAPDLDRVAGARVFLKCECFQVSGSFKFRGSLNATVAGVERGDQRGILGVSSGNHALAVAAAGGYGNVAATVVMLASSAEWKAQFVTRHGATLVRNGVTPENREDIAYDLLDKHNLRWMHPYDDMDVIHGAATSVLEALAQASELGEHVDAVLVPVGGGALLAAAAATVAAISPTTRVLGIEPAQANDAERSLAAGRLIALPSQPPTMADAASSTTLGTLAWQVIRKRHPEIHCVNEQEIQDATKLLWLRSKITVEPTAALPLAALMARRDTNAIATPGDTVVLMLTGGNLDFNRMMNLLAEV